MNQPILGIDIGGSGMKAGLVDLDRGEMLGERHRIATPQPATPDAMAPIVADLCDFFDYTGPVGCAFPGVIQAQSTVKTAANLDARWVDVNAADRFAMAGRPITMINDADAAGIAEVRYGAGRQADGTVILITIGTGLGSAIFTNGMLVPNTEFGHIELNGMKAETRASSRVIDDFGLSFEQWAPRIQAYLRHLEDLFWPDLLIVGGGISKDFDEWAPMVSIDTPLVPAELRNAAGIVGAALFAAEHA